MDDINTPKQTRLFAVIDWNNREVTVFEGRKAVHEYIESNTLDCVVDDNSYRINDAFSNVDVIEVEVIGDLLDVDGTLVPKVTLR